MSVQDPKRMSDGFSSLEAGVNSGSNPTIIAENQVSFAVNVTMRGGFATNRPGFKQLILRFASQDDMDWFEDHNVQGMGYYDPPNGTPVLIVSVGGRIFKVDPVKMMGANVIDITPDAGNSQYRPHAWMVQAEQYFIIQDGSSRAIIYDGATARRANSFPPLYEVPVGTAMEYGLGRLIVVLPNGRDYVIGDIAGGPTEVIQFTENTFLAEGGALNVPIPGKITSVRLVAVLDRSTGQGDLLVFTERGAVSARIGEERSTWKDIQFQTVALLNSGSVSQFSTAIVNGDIIYRARDGIRTLAMSQREFMSRWALSPISREVNRVLQYDTPALLRFCQAVVFDNRLLMATNPAPVGNGVYHRNLVALDFDLLSTMRQQIPPAYDGMWTGVRITAMATGEFQDTERCFVMHRNDDGENELWEVTRSNLFDNASDRIASFVETRSFGFQSPLTLKRLNSGDMSVDQVVGEVDFDVKYRPDQSPCWIDWHSWSECATDRDCSVAASGCMTVHNYRPQYRSRMLLPVPPSECEAGDNKPSDRGYEFAARLAWTGRASIRAFRAHAYDQQESPYGCAPSNDCRQVECCNIDPMAYVVQSQENVVSE